MNAKMESVEQIQSRRGEFENWSWLLMGNQKDWWMGNEFFCALRPQSHSIPFH